MVFPEFSNTKDAEKSSPFTIVVGIYCEIKVELLAAGATTIATLVEVSPNDSTAS